MLREGHLGELRSKGRAFPTRDRQNNRSGKPAASGLGRFQDLAVGGEESGEPIVAGFGKEGRKEY